MTYAIGRLPTWRVWKKHRHARHYAHVFVLFRTRLFSFVLQSTSMFTSQANQNNLMNLVAASIHAGSGRAGQALRLPLVVPGEVSGGQPGSMAALELADGAPNETNDASRAVALRHSRSRDRSRQLSRRSSRSRDRGRRRSKSRKRRRSFFFVHSLLERNNSTQYCPTL